MNKQEIEDKIKSLTEVMNQNLINSTVVEHCLDKIADLQKELDNLPDYPTKKGDMYILSHNKELIYEVSCFWCNGLFSDTFEEISRISTNTKNILIENTLGGFTEIEFSKLITV